MNKIFGMIFLIWLVGNIVSPLMADKNQTDCKKVYRERMASRYYDYKYYEGYAWNSISEKEKLIYLNGLWAGWDLSRDKMFKLSPENKSNFLVFQDQVVRILGPSIKHWREKLNNFYDNPENYGYSVYQAILKIGLIDK